MEQITELQPDLFAQELPSLEHISELSDFIHSSEANILSFTEKLQENITKTAPQTVLAVGIGLYILGRDAEAVEKLRKAEDCKEKFIYTAYALRRLRQFDESIENLQKALDHQADPLSITLEKARTYRWASNFQAAQNELNAAANFENVSAEYHYQLGRLHEAQGQYSDAGENYRTALEISPDHQKALFHLAYRCDLSGDEAAAIDYYKQIASTQPIYVNALMNLAILYEDAAKFEKASECIDKVLKHHPNHKRAILFKKDIDSSKNMYFDEEKQLTRDRKNKMLETPISDFELSVRSRNCLRKMNMNTIGDLLRITEAELLSYKNFGETSLREIKNILESKGLYLGMALEDKPFAEKTIDDFDMDEDPDDQGIFSKSVDELRLSVRARKCLLSLNMRTIGDLVQKTDAELLGCKNFGVTSLNEIKNALSNYGLSLRSLD